MLKAASGQSRVVQTTKMKLAGETRFKVRVATAAAATAASESPVKSILASTVPRRRARFAVSRGGLASSSFASRAEPLRGWVAVELSIWVT